LQVSHGGSESTVIARRLIENPLELTKPVRHPRGVEWRTAPVITVPGLLLFVEADRDRAVVWLDGDLDIASSGIAAQWLLALTAAGRTRIVLDLAALAFCDASGLGSLVRVSVRAAERGGWLRLVAPSLQTAQIVAIARLARVLPAYATVQDALAVADRAPLANDAVVVLDAPACHRK
jgi:anti-sigma B factor antagonist